MATLVEHTSEGIVYRCPTTQSIPSVDLLTLLFESELCSANEDTPIHFCAANLQYSLTKGEARLLTKQIAYMLRQDFGIGRFGPGKDIVSCISTGHYLLPALFYGIIAADGVFSASSPAATAKELEQHLRQAESKLLICNEDTRSVAIEAAQAVNLGLDHVLVIPRAGEMALYTAKEKKINLSKGLLDWKRITNSYELEHSFVVLIYSSGTTGLPKGVKLSHLNIVAECCIPGDAQKAYRARHKPSFEYRTLAHLPISHIAGIQGYFVNPFYHGGATYWMSRFDFNLFLEYNQKHKITTFFSVPPIYLAIAKSPMVSDQFSNLEYAISGAAAMGKELQREASSKLGRGLTKIAQTWGLSESTGSITLEAEGLEPDITGSVGMLIANHSARIVDYRGNDVASGSPGEIIVRGPVVTKGYHNNPHADAESFRDGWYYTGDIALWRDGRFYIIDRKKELIKYKAQQVAPAELEALLTSHPLIFDAAVIGVKLKDGNEVPRAFVVANREQISADDIDTFTRKHLSDYKRLRGGIVFVKTIPKSPSGKILRRMLRDMADQEEQSKL